MIKILIDILSRRIGRVERQVADLSEGITGDMVDVIGKVDTIIDCTTEMDNMLETHRRKMEERYSRFEEQLSEMEQELSELERKTEAVQEALRLQTVKA